MIFFFLQDTWKSEDLYEVCIYCLYSEKGLSDAHTYTWWSSD